MLSSIVSVVYFSPLSPLLYSKLRLPCAEVLPSGKKQNRRKTDGQNLRTHHRLFKPVFPPQKRLSKLKV